MSHTRKRTYIWTLVALFSLSSAAISEVPAPPRGAYVTRIGGSVKTGAGDILSPGMELEDGDIVNAEKNSWCEIKWKSAIVRAWQATAFQIQPSKNQIAVRKGSLKFFVNKTQLECAPYEVRTPHYRVMVAGTTINVTVSPQAEQITSFEDKVSVYDLRTNALVKSLEPGSLFSSTGEQIR